MLGLLNDSGEARAWLLSLIYDAELPTAPGAFSNELASLLRVSRKSISLCDTSTEGDTASSAAASQQFEVSSLASGLAALYDDPVRQRRFADFAIVLDDSTEFPVSEKDADTTTSFFSSRFLCRRTNVF